MLNLSNLNNLNSLGSNNSVLPWYLSSLFSLNNVRPTYISDLIKNLYYNSVNGARSFPYTFTRASNATMFDSQGRLVWASANMLLSSDVIKAPEYNLLTDTTISTDGTLAPAGQLANLCTEGTLGTALTQQQITGQAVNNQYAYTFEAKRGNHDWIRAFVGAGGNDVRAWFNVANGTVGSNIVSGTATIPKAAEIVDIGDGFYRCTIYAATIGASGPVFINVSATANASNSRVNNGTRYIGRQQVELLGPDSPKPLIKTTTAAYYGQRFDYNPVTLAARGFLSEPSRTNAVTTSDAITAVAVTVTTGASYFGGWTFQRITGNGAAATHIAASSSLTPPATQRRRISAVVKSISGSGLIQLAAGINHSDVNVYANFDLINGTIVGNGAGALDIRIVPFGNGLYKISYTYFTNAAPTSGALVVLYYITSASDLRAPSNSSTDVFDVNFWDGAATDIDTSIQPCFGTASTRAADVASEATGAWFDATKGTFYVEIERQFVNDSSGDFSGTFLQVHDGTNNNRYGFVNGLGTNAQHRFDTTVGGVAQAQPSATTTATARTVRKIAGTYALNSFRAVENGGGIGSDVSGTLPTGLTTINIGSAITANQTNGWIRQVRYYPDNSASDAQLQALTT